MLASAYAAGAFSFGKNEFVGYKFSFSYFLLFRPVRTPQALFLFVDKMRFWGAYLVFGRFFGSGHSAAATIEVRMLDRATPRPPR